MGGRRSRLCSFCGQPGDLVEFDDRGVRGFGMHYPMFACRNEKGCSDRMEEGGLGRRDFTPREREAVRLLLEAALAR